MFTVLSKPYDDNTIHDVYIVDHDTKTKEQFEFEWLQIKETLYEKDPNYDVSKILVALKRKGWQLLHVSHVEVTY